MYDEQMTFDLVYCEQPSLPLSLERLKLKHSVVNPFEQTEHHDDK